MSKLLDGKNAVVFGAAGSIGSAVAKEFALEGAQVFLAGRTQSKLELVAREITALGGQAQTQAIDALDDAAVNAYLNGIVARAGHIDAVFNAVGPPASDYANTKHAVDLTIEQFMLPLMTVLKSQFISARAAARHMIKQRSGAIIFLTGSPARGHVEGATAIGAAFGGIETLAENLAVEVGAAGVRAMCIRTTANVDTRTIQETIDVMASAMGSTKEHIIGMFSNLNFLKIPAKSTDTAKLAAFLASDRARMIAGTVVNSTAGAALD